jgi:phosphoesterase RecJ-like protein
MFKELINRHKRVTILFSIRLNGDRLSVALALYSILKRYKKSVEIVSCSRDTPIYLNFLPNFSKIKYKIDFEKSLIILFDREDKSRFNLKDREILDMSYYKNISYGDTLFKLFKPHFTIDRDSATCFYTSLLLDIEYFKTNTLTKEVFDVSSDIIAHDINISEISYNLNYKRSLSSLRILGSTLQGLRLQCDGQVSIMVVTEENIKKSGAKFSDLLGVIHYGISLVTVRVSITLIELDNSVYISLRAKKDINLLPLALYYNEKGDKRALDFKIPIDNIEVFLKDLISNIKKMGLLNEI